MPSSLDFVDPLLLAVGFAAVAVVLVVEALYLAVFTGTSYREQVNRRLRVLAEKPNREEALVELRRERGLTGEGFYRLPVKSFNSLLVQSGVRVGVHRMIAIMVAAAIVAPIGVYVWKGSIPMAACASVLAGLIIPILWLRRRRKIRMNRFGAQFPDAIDIIVRSIRAGHPVPIAIAMVAREMPDPVGTEFGMLGDEVTYGADLETAMRNLFVRVGQEDLPLFVTAVAIQSATGGNLSEILSNLSRVIRERFKMRRKIRALSSEGRFSAIALSSMPVLFFVAINFLNPGFYGEIIHLQVTQFWLGAAIGWMALGNLVMRNMINFKF